MNLDLAIGHTYPRQPVSWNQRDLILYALSVSLALTAFHCRIALPTVSISFTQVGAKANEPQFNYERDPNWHPLPTYPLVLTLKGESNDVQTFDNSSIKLPPGFPPIPNSKLIHAEQSIELLHPLPPRSGKGWTLERRIVGVKDTGQ